MKKILYSIFFLAGIANAQTKLAVQQLPQMPPYMLSVGNNNLIVYVGDSQTANGYTLSSITQSYRSNGYTTWANALSGSKLFSPVNGNQGVPANYTSDVIARLGTILALKPRVVTILIGTNDCSGNISAATIEANFNTIAAAFRSINCTMVWSTILPRFGTAALTSPQETVRQTVNTYLKTLNANDLIVIDAESSMNSSGDYASDGLHPNTTGAYILGGLFATQLNAIETNGNIIDALQADNNYTTNYKLTGTGGTTTSASGTVATSWTLNGASAGGATVTGSKDANDVQTVTLSGTYTGSSPNVLLTNGNTAVSTLKQGDVVEGFVDVEVTSPIAAANGISFFMDVYKTGGVEINQGYSFVTTDNIAFPITTGRYTFRTPPIVLSDVPTAFTNSVYIFLNTGSSTAISGSIKVYKAGIRKVPTAQNATAYQYQLSGKGYVKQSNDTTSYISTIPLATDVSGTLAVANGGTGNANGALSPVTDVTYDLGAATFRYNNAYLNVIRSQTWRAQNSNGLVFNSSGNTQYFKMFDASGDFLLQNGGTFTDNTAYRFRTNGLAMADEIDGVGTGTNKGIVAFNGTAAALGAQQYSPLSGVEGNYWNTTASASRTMGMYWQLAPNQGTSGTANLYLMTSIDGATPSPSGFQITSGGGVVCGVLNASAGGIGSTSTDGMYITNSSAATSGTPQWSRRNRWSGFYWNGSASTQAEMIAELQTSVSNDATWVLSGRSGGSGSFNNYFQVDALNGATKFGGTVQLKSYTVATLPTGVTGMIAYVTDANSPTWNSTVTGGGSSVVTVFYNGTNWVVQ